MAEDITRPEDMGKEDLARFVLDIFHRIAVHHTLWLREVEHQMGMPKALGVLGTAYQETYAVQMKRMAKLFNFELVEGIPKPLLERSREELLEAADEVSKNWLANDGIWFQAVEFAHGMNDAKRCNDSCWTRYSPFEAWSIRRLLHLPERPGLEGLKTALRFRTYARVNVQTIIDEGAESFVFQMNDCRVQSARKRKGLDDYPCTSVGLVEYTYFAEAIDPRIETECIGCPPGPHPEEWYCAWRFRLKAPGESRAAGHP
ncbi:DUF6125 family protein [Desulfatiglans anilini]|uniref:DUF6125 family protein n=1 Tax=Desulfatiglans anilini TaxID=90728 RepID=UPI0003F4F215|nr:DUF6125 family protein [Desulfatiglans anilini]